MSSYQKSKGRAKCHTFVMLIHLIIDSPNFLKLSGRAVKLLLLVARDYNGYNNGDLAITYSMMRKRGFTSNDQLRKAITELEHYRFLIRTRQGGKHQPSLYALTFHPIDECKGKHDEKPTTTPSHLWKIDQPEKPEFKK